MKILAMLILLFSSLARAGELDVITLADGTILRGHVTALKPGDHVELVLLDGRTQSIAWSEMTSSVGPSFPCELPYLTPAPGRVPLQVESTVLVHVSVTEWPAQVPACGTTPCTLYVPPGEISLSATGEETDPCPINLTVPVGGGKVTLHPASLRRRSSGVALLVAGAAFGVAGATLAAVGTTMNHQPNFSGTKMTYEDDSVLLEAIGGTIAGVGVGALVSGIVLLATNHASSEVSSFDGAIHF